MSKRQDKPDGIAWIIKNHPEVSDGQIGRLIGTTRTTIGAIRDRSHWNIANITPKDPVTLGLTTQRELDAAVAKAAKAAGIAAPTDTRFDSDREALIVELRHERERNVREDREQPLAGAGDEALNGGRNLPRIIRDVQEHLFLPSGAGRRTSIRLGRGYAAERSERSADLNP